MYPTKVYGVTYTTKETECPKCFGTNKIADINLDPLGDTDSLSGSKLLKQRIIKALLTNKGTNIYNQVYGSGLSNAIGKKYIGFSLLILQRAVFDAIDTVKDIQAKDLGFIPEEEILLGIENLNVSPDANDPRRYIIDLLVTNAKGETLNVGFNIGL